MSKKAKPRRLHETEAKAVARRIATSPLVKTALFGKDANWGRVLAAAGSAPYNGGFAHLDPDLVTLRYNGATVIERGSIVVRGVPVRRVGGRLVTTVFDLMLAQYGVGRPGLPGNWPTSYEET